MSTYLINATLNSELSEVSVTRSVSLPFRKCILRVFEVILPLLLSDTQTWEECLLHGSKA